MEYTNTRRSKPGGTASLPSTSPSLRRSKSGTHTSMSSPHKVYPCNNTSPSSSVRSFNNTITGTGRSKSTTKSRSREESSTIRTNITKGNNSNYRDNCGSAAYKFLQRGGGTSPRNKVTASAWALSPGRSGSPVVAPEQYPSSGKAKTAGSGGGMNGVLRYFRQKKKVSAAQEEELHRYKILNNRLVQWRFVNAGAAASMAARTTLAQKRLMWVGLRILKMRSLIAEKRKMIVKLKHEIKLYRILNPQIGLLNQWAKLEKKNCEALGRVTRKLRGISVRLPLDDAKGEEGAVMEAMNTAVDVMDGIEQVIKQFLYQVEKILYLMTELTITVKQEEECMEELEKNIPLLATSVIIEETLRAHLLQVGKD